MKADPISATKAIETALERIDKKKTVGAVRLDPVPGPTEQDRRAGVLVTPEGVAYPRLFDLPVDRDVLPPGVAETIAGQLVEDADDRTALDAMHAETLALFADLAAQLPQPPFLALHSSDAFPATPYSLFGPILSHTFERRWTRVWRVGGNPAKTTAQLMAGEERSRADRLREAGSRAAALTCCPVAARMIREDPGKWRARIVDELSGRTSTMAFRDGVYRPMTFIGGARWRESTLILKGEMPDTLRSAIEGRPLTALVEHTMIPDDITITGTAQRMGDGEVYVRTDAKPVPMAPILAGLGIELEDPSCNRLATVVFA